MRVCSSYFVPHRCCHFGDICSSCCCVLVCIRCLVNSHQNVLMHEWISYRHVGKCMFTFRNFHIYTVCSQLSYHGKRSSFFACVSIRFLSPSLYHTHSLTFCLVSLQILTRNWRGIISKGSKGIVK